MLLTDIESMPLLAVMSLPHKKTEKLITMSSGDDYTLKVIAKPGVGLPYGSIPRLILAWIMNDVSLRKSSRFQSKDLMNFMRQMGPEMTDGQVKEQLKRLASTTFQFTYRDSQGVEKTDDMRLFECFTIESKDKSGKQTAV